MKLKTDAALIISNTVTRRLSCRILDQLGPYSPYRISPHYPAFRLIRFDFFSHTDTTYNLRYKIFFRE